LKTATLADLATIPVRETEQLYSYCQRTNPSKFCEISTIVEFSRFVLFARETADFPE
jgi:hypothetical protein